MKRSMLVAASLLVLSTAACCPRVTDGSKKFQAETMERLASDLVYLTAAVEAVILDGTLPPGVPDAEVVRFATKHDPRIAEPFTGYVVRVDRGERDAVLLVCSADGATGLILDATCTSRSDRSLWHEPVAQPCAFPAAAPPSRRAPPP